MLKAVLARSPLPTSAAVYTAAGIPASKRKLFKENGASVSFLTKAKAKEAVSDASVPPGFRYSAGEVELRVPSAASTVATSTKKKDLLAGLGAGPTIRDYRLAVTSAVRKAKRMDAAALVIQPPTEEDISTVPDLFHPARPLAKNEVLEKTAAFAVAGAYEYTRLKTTKAADTTASSGANRSSSASNKRGGKKTTSTTTARGKASRTAAAGGLDIVIASNQSEPIRTGAVIGGCINDCRNLGNLREDEGTPAFYVEWAKRFMVPEGVKVVKVLKGEEIRKAGLNLLHAVGRGSKHEPYVLIMEYVGNKQSSKSTALVGKGVTFDCGGLNVKPYGSMETMYTDMMGAATVLSTLKAVATLKLPVNVVGAVGFVENAIGPESYFPSSIITSLKGLTVEVLNTDAEGRLVLADVLTYVQSHARLAKTPTTIIDLATLTGAVIVSLGSRRAGLFGNSVRLSEKLMMTGTQSGEELWPMPIGPEHVDMMKGGVADLVNAAAGRQAGACTAAAFLSNFVEPGKEWAHLDIAGTADVGDKPKGFHPAGVTGFGVQLLVDYLRKK